MAKVTFQQRLKNAYKAMFSSYTTVGHLSIPLNDNTILYTQDRLYPIDKGYNANDMIYSIVRRIAQNYARSPEGVYDIVDEKKYNERKYLLFNKKERSQLTLTDLKTLAEKSIQPNEKHDLNKVLQEPNNNQSHAEYLEMRTTFKLLTGDAFEWCILNGRNNPISFEILPSNRVFIKTDKLFPVGIVGYRMALNSTNKDFELNEIIQTSYPNPNWDEKGTHLYGVSPLRAGLRALMTDNSAKETMAELLHNRGARSMLFIDADSDTSAQENTDYLREKFRTIGKDYRNEVTVGVGRPTLINFGFTPEELKITDNNKITREQLCNIFNVPSALFNNDAQTTRDNVKTYQKDFILNAVFPEKKSQIDSLNRHAYKLGWIKKGKQIIDFDSSVYNELETDRSELWKWLKDAPFTENEKRVFLNEQPIDIAEMDKIYLSSNKVPIELCGKVNIRNNEQQGQASQEATN